ncbi:CPBP family intramembrane glutamic endopeptidase [Aureibacillus halotolerans]|uniref:CAAX prenyl protease 2/Lysostaphin resistance protein A-like domain-containing protein n=1 Tax=Aureibacillus halotolerans TaxID=1508390 RepID=A0A4R6TZ93_9BACI|nr:type II CAAX endopeptidase family protein [Aureibacillus halotolerans]TDQ37389.1 hypothetical protein EV213_11323 [Aureibacillus halotolerans]
MNSNPSTTPEHIAQEKRRPGWPEIGMMVLGYVVVMAVAIPLIFTLTEEGSVVHGISLAALSGLAGLGAFFAAYILRIRSGASFGFRRTSGRWLLVAVGLGLGVFVLARIFVIVIYYGFGYTENTQESYIAAANGGTVALLLQLVMIAVLTPLGEEFAFRGVLTNALQKYGPWVSILGSAVIFATAHGINEVWPLAFFAGLATGYLFYRTGSIWPCVVVHAVNNAAGTLFSVIAVNYIV